MDDVEPLIEVTVPASVDDTWSYLRDPAKVARWFGWEYEGLEAEIRLIFLGEGIDDLMVDESGAPLEGVGFEVDDRAHAIEWRYGPDRRDLMEVLADPEGARVRVRRWTPAEEDDRYDDVGEGWISFVQQLRFALTRHPGEERRTVFLSSPVEVAGTSVLAALGLNAAAELEIGAAYAAEVGPGDALTGTVWSRSPHQVGLTVDQWGDGLLVVTERGPSDDLPNGAGTLTATVHGVGGPGGLDEAGLDQWRERWSAWWADHIGVSLPAPQ